MSVVVPMCHRRNWQHGRQSIHHVAVDVAVSEDGRGGFLLAVLKCPPTGLDANQALMPINGENVTLKVVRTSAETFTRSDGHIWSSLALHEQLAGGLRSISYNVFRFPVLPTACWC